MLTGFYYSTRLSKQFSYLILSFDKSKSLLNLEFVYLRESDQ